MVLVTPAAAGELRALLKHSRATGEQALRLVPDGRDGIGMMVSVPEAGDEVVADEAGPVLIIAAALVSPLSGLVFDWVTVEVDGEMRRGFTLREADAGEITAADKAPDDGA